MYFFGYSNEKPHVQYSVADEAGVITHKVGFNLREPIMMHDFAVTQDYAVWMDVPLCYRPQVRGCSLTLDCTITPTWRVIAIPGELCTGNRSHLDWEPLPPSRPSFWQAARGAESRGRTHGLCHWVSQEFPTAERTTASKVGTALLQGHPLKRRALRSVIRHHVQHPGSCLGLSLPTNMQEMISKDLSTALPWQYHPENGARIGLLPKYAEDASQLRWFDLPGFFAFHTANAWQEGPLVHLFVAAFDEVRPACGCI